MNSNIENLWYKFKNGTKDEKTTAKKSLIASYINLIHYTIHNSKLAHTEKIDDRDIYSFGLEGLSEAIDRFDPDYGTKFETYTIQRIRGKIIDELRKLSVSSNKPSLIESTQMYDGYDMPQQSPADQIEKDEQKEKLIRLIKSLSERDRLIISLYYYENLNYKEIADTLGITVSRVSQIHTKILKEMKKELALSY